MTQFPLTWLNVESFLIGPPDGLGHAARGNPRLISSMCIRKTK